MSPFGRALLGAALGSCIALLADGTSRAFMTGFVPKPEAETVVWDLSGFGTPKELLKKPSTLGEASAWLQAAAERMVRHRELSPEETQTVYEIAQEAAQQQPDNAYWRQMAAVMLADMNKWPEAKQEWIHASTATRWDNLQGPKLEDAEQGLSKLCGTRQGWHYCAAYYCRNKDAAFEILSVARKIISQTPRDGQDALKLRYATLENGVLLRDGAKSMAEMEMGVQIVEVSSHPPQLAMNTQHGLKLSQKALERGFKGLGMMHEVQVAEDAFQENESKQHYIGHQDDDTEIAMNFSLSAVAIATLPGTMLIIGLVGLAFVGLGKMVDRHAPTGAKFSWLALAIAGSVVGIAVYSITRMLLPALAPLLCFLFLQFTPKVERTMRSSDLGPLFGFTVFVLAATFVCLLAAFLAGFGPAAGAVLPFLGVPVDLYGGSSLFLALAILVLGVLLLITPFWAFAQRSSTPFVLGKALQKLGLYVAWGCLVLAVLGGPLAIYADSRIGQAMEQISGNEPLYYLNHASN